MKPSCCDAALYNNQRACVAFHLSEILGANGMGGIMKRTILGVASAALCTTALIAGANAATATRGAFGALSDGAKVEAVTLTNGTGMSAKVMTLGATLQ